MIKLLKIFVFFSLINTAKADYLYNWSISGLNVRETPSPKGKVLGKIKYGEKLDFDLANQEYSLYHEDKFLIGNKDDGGADIKFSGSWMNIIYKGISGYVFSGYLSRYPTFKYELTSDEIIVETYKEYMNRNFNLLNYNNKTWLADYNDNQIRSFLWENGIVFVNDNSDKGIFSTVFFPNMTLNEALQFVKFYFHIFDTKNPKNRDELCSSIDFYGLLFSDNKVEINFPAPDGKITILKINNSIVITYYGGC